MVAATTLKARLCGLLVDRIEDMVAREKLAAEREGIGEVRKAGQLLADAAKWLDLPERAIPAQIVGALAAGIHHARSVRALTRKQDGGK